VEARADQESRIRSLERTRWTWGGAVTVISILGAVLAKKLGWSFLPWLLWTSAVLALYPGSTRNGCQPE
jgi:hypothetical protein